MREHICKECGGIKSHDIKCKNWVSQEEIDFINEMFKNADPISEEDKREIFGCGKYSPPDGELDKIYYDKGYNDAKGKWPYHPLTAPSGHEGEAPYFWYINGYYDYEATDM